MLFTLLKSYLIWLLISCAVCVVGTLSGLLYSPSLAKSFVVSYVYHWNGLLVPTLGFGALHFALATFKGQFNYLLKNILEFKEGDIAEIYYELTQLYSFKNKQIIAIPIFLLGAFTLYLCGYPMQGFPKTLLWLSSSMMFYAGGLMLAYAAYSIKLFHVLECNIERIELQDNVHILELENFNLYLSTLFFIAVVALYFAFRGTLTANFDFIPPSDWARSLVLQFVDGPNDYKLVRNLLIYPIPVFLPLALFAGFYVRLILRKIYLSSIKKKVLEIDKLAMPFQQDSSSQYPAERVLQIRNSAMELKEKIIQSNRTLPLVDIKDSPSIVLLMIIFIQFIINHDGTIKGFIDGVLGIST